MNTTQKVTLGVSIDLKHFEEDVLRYQIIETGKKSVQNESLYWLRLYFELYFDS